MNSTRPWIVGLALLAVLALGPTACGGSDDGSANADGANGDRTAAQQSAPADPAADRRAIRTELRTLQDAFYAGKGAAWCARVSAHAASTTAKSVPKRMTCAQAVNTAVPVPVPAAAVRKARSNVLGIRLAGNKATVKVSQSKQPPIDIEFVREDGAWKLDSGIVLGPAGASGGS